MTKRKKPKTFAVYTKPNVHGVRSLCKGFATLAEARAFKSAKDVPEDYAIVEVRQFT